jgi:hypothetical protein
MAPPDGKTRRSSDRRRALQSEADRKRVLVFACIAAGLVASTSAACKHEAPPPAPAPVTAPPPTPAPAKTPPPAAPSPVAEAPSPDAKAALAWIDALRARDSGAVLAKSVVPFDFRDGSPKKRCGTGAAKTRAAAAAVTRCLAKDESFHADLSATPEPRLITIDAAALPPWAQPWAKTLPPGVRAISTIGHGEREARVLLRPVGAAGGRGLSQNVIVAQR